jgi:hypothetical protein
LIKLEPFIVFDVAGIKKQMESGRISGAQKCIVKRDMLTYHGASEKDPCSGSLT